MKKQKSHFRLKKALFTLTALILICAQFFIQTSFFEGTFKNISFDSSSQVISSGDFQEIRQTADGNIIQRFFTGLKEIPYVDYLVLNNPNGNVSLVPIREESRFFETTQTFFEDFILFKEASAFEKKTITVTIAALSLFLVALLLTRFIKKSEHLLFATLSRQQVWLTTQRIRQ